MGLTHSRRTASLQHPAHAPTPSKASRVDSRAASRAGSRRGSRCGSRAASRGSRHSKDSENSLNKSQRLGSSQKLNLKPAKNSPKKSRFFSHSKKQCDTENPKLEKTESNSETEVNTEEEVVSKLNFKLGSKKENTGNLF